MAVVTVLREMKFPGVEVGEDPGALDLVGIAVERGTSYCTDE